jgi:Ca-activated chloride channel homolog
LSKNRILDIENFAKMLKRLIFGFIFGFCLFNVFAEAQEQQTPTPTPTPKQAEEVVEDEGVLKVSSTLVTVPVSVTDAAGQPVKGLTINDFRLAEEGRAQQLEQLGNPEEVPLEIALLFDVSSSVNKIFELEKDAAARFVQSVMKPQDRATLFLIGEKPVLGQTRSTADEAAVKIRAVLPASRVTATAFYDTLTAATEYLRQTAPSRSRRVVLVFSDGEDNYSDAVRNVEVASLRGVKVDTLTQKDLDKRADQTARAHGSAQAKVLRDLQNADTVFYSINASGPSVKLNKASLRAQNAMQRFADETGGTAFLPQFANEKETRYFEQRNTETLERIFQQISAELRAQYLLQYYSDANYQEGKYVKLNVNLTSRPNLRLRARQGYFAKTQ